MLHLIQHHISHLQATSAGAMAPRAAPIGATSHICGESLAHHKALKFSSNPPPWETQVSVIKKVWHQQITPDKWKSLILAEIGKNMSHCSAVHNMQTECFDVGPSEPPVSRVRSLGNGQALAKPFDFFLTCRKE